jgi:hypothetical protein
MTPPAAAAALPGAIPTRPAPARPARPAGPARRPAPPARPAAPDRARPARPGRAAGPARRVARVDASAVSRLLDRLIRSRIWIVLVAFALIGIVAMQLWLLKLNGGIGRAIEHESYLQRANATLSAENAAESAGDLVEQHAIANGMTIVPAGSLVFLHTRGPVDERQAAARLAQPAQAPGAAATAPTSTSATSTPEVPVQASGQAASTAASGTSSEASTQTPATSTTPAAGSEAQQTLAASTAPTADSEVTPSTPQPEPQG